MAKARVLIPSGALGIGFDLAAFEKGVAMKPDIIAIDGGSTDSGPHYLGTGTAKYARSTIKDEWRVLMKARAELGVPLLIGTAGTCGADTAVDWMVEITQELAKELGQDVKLAVLKSGQDQAAVGRAFKDNQVKALEPVVKIDQELIASCTNIVALAGAEQIQEALNTGADILIAGRATDTAVIAAYPLMAGCHAGGAWHGAKIGECGALATTNPTSGSILIDFDDHGFTVTALADSGQATPRTVSAHMLYENADPYILYEPGGYLDVRDAQYQSLNDKQVRVTGSQWHQTAPYTVKLEGARLVGYQTVSMVTIRDAHYVENARDWAKGIEAHCSQMISKQSNEPFDLQFRLIGLDATLGRLEKLDAKAHEVGVMCIVTAQSQARATEIAKLVNPFLLHYPLTKNEPLPTFAFPYSPPEIDKGPIHEFCLNHILEIDDPMAPFTLTQMALAHA